MEAIENLAKTYQDNLLDLSMKLKMKPNDTRALMCILDHVKAGDLVFLTSKTIAEQIGVSQHNFPGIIQHLKKYGILIEKAGAIRLNPDIVAPYINS